MSKRFRNLLLGSVCLAAVACATSIFLVTRASVESSAPAKQAEARRSLERGPRNLFLHPEALRVARQLGKRFGPSARGTSVMVGTVTVDGTEQQVRLARQQTQTGESVELHLAGRFLSWSDREGTRGASGPALDHERLLVERLTLDSPDQFVLAQLRGASYFTIARKVRPAGAVDGYAGPLWDLVRVDERQQDDGLRPQSTWRIFYLNVQTSLPERVEYQLNGQDISAEFLEWTEQQGEKTPIHVRWTSNGQPIMEYRAASVSHNQ